MDIFSSDIAGMCYRIKAHKKMAEAASLHSWPKEKEFPSSVALELIKE